jgi:hypothetical protein
MPTWMPKTAVWTPVAVMSLALLVGACSTPDQYAPACPGLKVLSDAADITEFNGRGQDVTDMLLSAHITSVPATCKAGPKGMVDATMNVIMVVNHGPAMAGRNSQVPFFVTVMDGDRVLQQKDYATPVVFPPNVEQGQATSEQIFMEFPVTPQKSAAAYTIYVGIRLAPDQLQYNRRNPTQ